MAVNLPVPQPAMLRAVSGVSLGVAMAGVRKQNRKDLLVIRLEEGAAVAGVFTQNTFAAAPVLIARKHLRNRVKALVVNTGNANAGTGTDGVDRAMRVCAAVAKAIGCAPEQVLPFSTGVIMEPLPDERIIAAIPAALVGEADWLSAAEAIMTTDTVPKAQSTVVQLSGGPATISGIAKGSGMIRPNMATMLGFVATDARIHGDVLQDLVRRIAERSFNCISVDGDTSTNDAFIVISSGRGPAAESAHDLRIVEDALTDVSRTLAQAIVRDGEGATKFVTVRVERGGSVEECRLVAYAIAHSPLVKTAFFASDPNLGRLLAAIGNCGIDAGTVALYLDDELVAEGGSRAAQYDESRALAVLKKPEFAVRVVLNRGSADATVWTCDLSFDYVKINAEYRT